MAKATTTFDPGFKGANVTLSGSNLVATVSSSLGEVRATQKLLLYTYFEMVIGATMTGVARVGLISSVVTNFTQDLGNTAASADLGYLSGGTVRLNNAVVATIASFVANDNIGVAVDLVNQKIWFRKNGGNWNNDVIANQNPVGAVGGISIAAMPISLMPAFGGSATSSATAKFTAASWTYAAPTGFVSVDDLPGTLVNGLVARRTASFTQYGYAVGSGSPATGGTRDPFPAAAGGWFGGYKVYVGPDETIMGETQVGGVNVPHIPVFLYDRVTGILLGKTISDSGGNFEIHALGRDLTYVVGTNSPYNAAIQDLVDPL